jgi:hypothetical protein
MEKQEINLIRSIVLIVLSIIVAVVLVQTGILKEWLIQLQEWKIIGIIVAGIFFVSIFTAVPAGVALFEMVAVSTIWEVAFWGAVGCLIGDLLIFRFIKNSLVNDVKYLLGERKRERLHSIFNLRIFQWLIPFISALVIASPLPDEIGLIMMGASKMKMKFFIPISFILNFLGILLIAFLAK